jgi:hypothetical protein
VTAGTNDKKKVAVLAVLGLVAAYLLYANVLSGPATAPPPRQADAAAVRTPVSPLEQAEVPEAKRSTPARARNEEFRPVLRSKRPEERIDPVSIDPTLRLDLLAKLQQQEAAGGTRNLFQFTAATVKAQLPKGPEPKVMPRPGMPQPGAAPVAQRPSEAPVPPPPYKYYGYSTEKGDGKKTAFFLDGEEIVVAHEGDVVGKRYRLVRIGPASAVLEEMQSKRQQPVPLVPEAGG